MLTVEEALQKIDELKEYVDQLDKEPVMIYVQQSYNGYDERLNGQIFEYLKTDCGGDIWLKTPGTQYEETCMGSLDRGLIVVEGEIKQ